MHLITLLWLPVGSSPDPLADRDAGPEMSHVVGQSVLATDMDAAIARGRLASWRFRGGLPVSRMVEVARLAIPEVEVEISVIAVSTRDATNPVARDGVLPSVVPRIPLRFRRRPRPKTGPANPPGGRALGL
jgi:hypothetical protein